MKGEPIKREKAIRVRVTDDLYARLEKLADLYGQAPSVCAAWAVAIWVVNQERTAQQSEQVAQAVANQVGGQVLGMMQGEELPPLLRELFKDQDDGDGGNVKGAEGGEANP